MKMRNLMVDVTSDILEELQHEDTTIILNEAQREDVIAYVLNRMPPRYYTSERGLLHGKIESKKKVQQRVDVIFLIYEAINAVIDRRTSSVSLTRPANPSPILPHIIGIVLDASTLDVMPDVEVHLLHGGKPAAMIDQGWRNPYTTNLATGGYYHFWPSFNAGVMENSARIPFTLVYRHPSCDDVTVTIDVPVLPDTDAGKSHPVPTVLMEPKAGNGK